MTTALDRSVAKQGARGFTIADADGELVTEKWTCEFREKLGAFRSKRDEANARINARFNLGDGLTQVAHAALALRDFAREYCIAREGGNVEILMKATFMLECASLLYAEQLADDARAAANRRGQR